MLVNGESERQIQGVVGKVVITINPKNGFSHHYGIHELIQAGYTIRQPEQVESKPKHYLGFPIGDYSGKNIIVEFDIWDGTNTKTFDVLREVKEDCFITEKYLTVEAKLAPCNNHEFKIVGDDSRTV